MPSDAINEMNAKIAAQKAAKNKTTEPVQLKQGTAYVADRQAGGTGAKEVKVSPAVSPVTGTAYSSNAEIAARQKASEAQGQRYVKPTTDAERQSAIEQRQVINQASYERQYGNNLQQEGQVFDPYAALRDRSMNIAGGQDAVSASPYIQQGKAEAIRNKYMEGAGNMPEPTPPPEGGWESEEQRLQAQSNDQTRLANWWKKVGEASIADTADVVTLTQESMTKTEGYQKQIDDLIANLNQANPPMGKAMEGVLNGVNTENLTPDVMSKLQTLADSGITPEEFTAKAAGIIADKSISSNLTTLGINSTDEGYDLGNGVVFGRNADGSPILDVENIPDNASAADLLKMEAALDQKIGQKQLEQDLAQWNDYNKSMIRANETALAEIKMVFGDARAKVDEAKLTAMNEAKYNQMKLEIAKDRSLNNILEQEANMEGYLTAQMEAWGASSSTGALKVMQKNKLKFTKQFAETEQDYNLELSRVSDKITEAQMAFTNRSVELANQEAIAIAKLNNGMLDGLDKVQTGVSSAFANKDMKDLQIVKDLLGGMGKLNAAADAAKAEAAKDTRDFNFKLMKEYADNTGYAYEMLPDGSIQVMTNANGSPVLTEAAKRRSSSSSSNSSSPSTQPITPKQAKAINGLLVTNPLDPDYEVSPTQAAILIQNNPNDITEGYNLGDSIDSAIKKYGVDTNKDQVFDYLAGVAGETDKFSPLIK